MKRKLPILTLGAALLLAGAGTAVGGTLTNLINVQYRGSAGETYLNGPSYNMSGAAVLGSAGNTWNSEQVHYYTGPSSGNIISGASLVNSANAASGLTLTLGYSGPIVQGARYTAGALDANSTTNLMQSCVSMYTYTGSGASASTTTHTIGGLSSYNGATANLIVYAGAPSAVAQNIAITGGATGGNSGTTLTTSSTSRQLSAGKGVAYNSFTNLTLNGGSLVFTVNEPSAASSSDAGFCNGFQLQIFTPDPSITTPPASQRVLPGQTATFSVAALGSPTLAYQWQANGGTGFTNLVNGGQISGATTSTLTISNVTANWTLTYQVIVTNSSGSVTSSPATLATSRLIDVDIGNSAGVQTGAAVLGASGDVWNAISAGGSFSPVVDSASNTVTGAAVSLQTGLSSYNYNGTGGSAVDAGTAALMNDFMYSYNPSVPFTVSITGLGTYVNQPFTLVAYSAMGANQGATLNLSGGSGGNSASTLTTTGASKQLSAGIGVAYNTFTGTVASGTLTITFSANNDPNFHGCNGFQLQLAQPDPLITANPVSRTNVNNTTATFSVTATGSAQISYQWQEGPVGGPYTNLVDGGQILGSASNFLSISSLTTNWAGAYQVIVSNSDGSVTSTPPAILTVLTSPIITVQPASQTTLIGNTVSFNVTALGTPPLSYQWQAGPVGGPYTSLTDAGQISGSQSNVLTIVNVASNQTPAYVVIVSNSSGSVTSAPAATLTVYPNTLNIDVDFGSGATQTGAAVLGTVGDTWNAVTATTSTIANTTGNNLSGIGLTLTSSGVYTATAGTPTDPGTTNLMQDYAFGNGTTVTVSLNGLAPYINSPFTLVVYAAGNNSGQGGSVTLAGATGGNTAGALTASATSRQISAGPGVAYNTFTGILTNSTLSFTSALLTGQSFTAVNGFQLQFAPATNDPSLLVAPVSQTVPAGATASFNVTAAGTSPFNYQWQVNNGNGFTNLTNGGQVSGANTNVLTITGAAASYVLPNWNWAGNYRVIVTNSVGSITSSPATLIIAATGVYVPPGGDANGAVNTAYNNGGGTVNLGPGYYYGGITMGPGVTLNGAGSNTIIAGASIQGAQPTSGSGYTVQNLVVDGQISCSAFSVGGSGPAGILAGYQSGNPASYNITYNNVEVRNTSIAMQAWNVNGLYLNHCNFHDNGIGFSHTIYFTGDYNVNVNNTILSWGRAGYGAHLDFSQNVAVNNTFNQCEINGCSGYGVLNQGYNDSGNANPIQFYGCKIQFNGQSGGAGDGVNTDGGGAIQASLLEYNHGYGVYVTASVALLYDVFNGNSTDYYWSHGTVANDLFGGNGANEYDAIFADGVTGPNNTADWVTSYGGGSAGQGAVDFNANHSANGSLTWSTVSSTGGTHALNIGYANGTSSNLTMQVIVNGGSASLLTFPPTGGWSTYSTASMNATLTAQNNSVKMQVAYPGATSPILSSLTVSDSVPGAPAAPTGLTYLALTNAPKYDMSCWIQLNWNQVPGATYYDILRNGLWIAINVPTNSFTDKHVWTSGSAQNYTVIAVNAGGSSSSAITAYSFTGFPISMSATANGPGSVTTTCAASYNASSYNVYRSTSANGPFTEIAAGVGTSYTDNSAPGGTDYYYMTAYNGLTESLPSSTVSVNVTPITLAITTQPASQTTSVGANVSFNVVVTGYPPLGYQWQAGPPGGPYTNLVNGGQISGSTSNVLTISNVTTNWALAYQVIVTNSQGSVTSTPAATLTVNLSPLVTAPPASQTSYVGGNVSFNVGVAGVPPFSYQWQSGPVGGPYANLVNGGQISGATSSNLMIVSVTTNWAGVYQVIVSNSYGSVTSAPPATLTVLPAGPIAIANWSFENPVVADGSYTTTTPSWTSSGTAGAFAIINPGTGNWPSATPAGMDSNNCAQIFMTAAGQYGILYQDVGVKYQAGVTYQLTVAVGLQNNQTFDSGSALVFYNSALTAIASDVITSAKLISGAFTNLTLSYTGTGAEGGNGDILVGFYAPPATTANSYFDFDNVRLSVISPATAPTVTVSPAVTNAQCGSNLTLTANAAGAAPLGYQWYDNQTNLISGATGATLVLTNLHAPQAGSWSVVVTNAYGAGTNSGTVNVVDTTPPVITYSFGTTNVNANSQCQALMPNVTGTNYIVAYDACSGSVTVTQTPTNNAVLALGTNAVVLAVADGNGNTAYSTNQVVVVDTNTVPPVITQCVPAQSVTNGPGCQVALPDFTGLLVAVPSDPCSSGVQVVQLPAPGTVLSIGGYTVYYYVNDGRGHTNSCSGLVTIYDGVTPAIVTQPASQTNNLGSNVTFTVSATACSALSYQWYFNTNTALANQTNATLSFTVASTNAGTYSVVISSAGGQTNSQAAVLTVVGQPPPPVLVSGKVLSDKTFQLTLNGPSNETYRVLSSTNAAAAISNWLALTTNTFSGVQTNYTDTDATNYRTRVYRVQAPAP